MSDEQLPEGAAQALNAALSVILDALAWLEPSSARKLMDEPAYREFKGYMKVMGPAEREAQALAREQAETIRNDSWPGGIHGQ